MKILLFLLLAWAFTACETAVKTATPASAPSPISTDSRSPAPAVQPSLPATAPAAPSDRRVKVDAELQNTLRVLKVTSTNTSGNALRIEIDVQNLANSPKSFNYRIYWFDRNGTMIDLPGNVWLPLFLVAHETSSIVAVAPTPLAEDFRARFFSVR